MRIITRPLKAGLLCGGLLLALSRCTAPTETEAQADTEIKYDSAIFSPNIALRNTGRERFATVTLNPENARGTYESDIAGLDINPVTGAINIDKSEAGIRYTVRFVPEDPKLRPDTTAVMIAGIDYVDSTYVLARNRNRAFPIYNADRNYARSKGAPGLPPRTSARLVPSFGFANTLPNPLDSANGSINLQRAKDIILARRRSTDGFTNPLNLTVSYTVRDSANVRTVRDTTTTSPGPRVEGLRTVRSTVSVQVYHYEFTRDIPVFVRDAMRARTRFPLGRSEAIDERPVIIVILDRD